MRTLQRRKGFSFAVAAAVLAQPSPAGAQAPGTVLPGPTGAQDYAERVNRQIDKAKKLLETIPDKWLDPTEKRAGKFSADELKALNDSRAKAIQGLSVVAQTARR